MVVFADVWSSLELGCISGFLCSKFVIVVEFSAFLMHFLISKIINPLLEVKPLQMELQKYHGPGDTILLE